MLPVERWATFDCYGTLVDWPAGIGAQLERLFGSDARRTLARPLLRATRPEIQADGAARVPRVMARALAGGSPDEAGLELPEERDERTRDVASLWPVFHDVRPALEEARGRGWRLAILSNTDRDLIDASIAAIGVPFDLSIVASEIGSYKPAHRHWQAFRERVGPSTRHVHVAQSLYHDHGPARELGIPSIWIDRLGEAPDPRPYGRRCRGSPVSPTRSTQLAPMTELRPRHARRRRRGRGRS